MFFRPNTFSFKDKSNAPKLSFLITSHMYLDPWGPRNLLFFAGWTMLTATWVLFKHRDEDKILNITFNKNK